MLLVPGLVEGHGKASRHRLEEGSADNIMSDREEATDKPINVAYVQLSCCCHVKAVQPFTLYITDHNSDTKSAQQHTLEQKMRNA